MKRLIIFVLLAITTIQVKLYAQQESNAAYNATANTAGHNGDVNQQNPEIKDAGVSAVNDNSAGVQGGDGIGKKAAKHARQIKSFFSKISREISKGYVKIASEKSATAVIKSN